MNLHSKVENGIDNAEIEIMEFMIGSEAFGIDVTNVREIMTVQEVTPAALSHPMVEGLFKPRDILYTVIALPSFIRNTMIEKNPKDLFILTDYEGMNIAYRVNSVNGIVRVNRSNIQKADRSVGGDNLRITKGVVTYEGRLISILDLHQIMSDIIPKEA
ncbi:MAG: chemotaxis protein CheW [Peptostreptococcaceae bacterium]|nr:chemotaxis protein CheW [Peptostreptococcaceae bacterium]